MGDHEMLEYILFAPFRAPFKNIYLELVLSDVGFDGSEYLKALANTSQFALQHKNDCNGIQAMDLSANNLGQSQFANICTKYIINFFSLEELNIDFNFKLNKTKKGYHSSSIKALCSMIEKMQKLKVLSLRGDWANNLYLTFEDLLPLLQFIGDTKLCQLEYLHLDGNRIKDDGCKVIANSLQKNNILKVISIEDNKCSFKGFTKMIESILSNAKDTKLCDIPMHSILDDPNFSKKIKKLSEKIEKCIKIIQVNRVKDTKEQELQIRVDMNLRRVSQAPFADEQELKKPQSPILQYTQPKKPGNVSNVDKLAAIMLDSSRRRSKLAAMPPLKEDEKKDDDQKQKTVPFSSEPQRKQSNTKSVKQTKAKIVSSGIDAKLNKVTTTTNKNNAKSKRKKKTRKKLAV